MADCNRLQVRHAGIADALAALRHAGVVVLANAGNCRGWWRSCTGLPWPAVVRGITPVGAATFGTLRLKRSPRPHREREHSMYTSLDPPCEVETFATCGAIFTSGAVGVFGAAVTLILEAIEAAGYPWQRRGATVHDAVLVIIRETGTTLVSMPKRQSRCKTGRYCVNLERALERVLGWRSRAET